MSRIYVTPYEVIGDGLAVAAAHYAAIDAAAEAHWAFVKQVGGEGYRPLNGGGLRSVFFKELPTAWRKIGWGEGGRIEAVPHKGSATGKSLAKQIAALPQGKRGRELAYDLGYNPKQMAMDGSRGVIYFPTDLRVTFPAERIFVRIPRFTDDGFEPDPAILRELRESEFMAAVEAHNAEARRQREEREAA
ncbi:MAG: hypothetical protein J7496_08745 [Novosphingobium sp.]|nr:hypothetical protein [Novosphingobium sp.]